VLAPQNEVRVLQALAHPYIVAYHDSFVSAATRSQDAKLSIVMEWASGGDLGSLISRRKQLASRFSEKEVLKYCWQMCSALAHCHHSAKVR
jgi:serine/threonine protein kinase